MRAVSGLTLGMAALAACAAPVAESPRGSGTPLRVAGLQHWQGADAKRLADARCGAGGVRTSIYDRYDRAAGEWVFREGCR
ncbi:MAG: hypothetical protein KF887_10435 [Paracoccaceae bacterium]|nr:MAG: hypothetical protein KF887_10435 [Paracoccaceae bacterium]